jgi:hypothetical protein
MKKKLNELLKKLRELDLPSGQYAIYGSGPMAVRRLRDAHDLDVVVKNKLYKKLRKKYKEVESGRIKIGDIDIFSSSNVLINNPDEVIKRAETFQRFKFIRLDDLVRWKQKLGREIDLKDIKLIREYLDKERKSEK